MCALQIFSSRESGRMNEGEGSNLLRSFSFCGGLMSQDFAVSALMRCSDTCMGEETGMGRLWEAVDLQAFGDCPAYAPTMM